MIKELHNLYVTLVTMNMQLTPNILRDLIGILFAKCGLCLLRGISVTHENTDINQNAKWLSCCTIFLVGE